MIRLPCAHANTSCVVQCQSESKQKLFSAHDLISTTIFAFGAYKLDAIIAVFVKCSQEIMENEFCNGAMCLDVVQFIYSCCSFSLGGKLLCLLCCQFLLSCRIACIHLRSDLLPTNRHSTVTQYKDSSSHNDCHDDSCFMMFKSAFKLDSWTFSCFVSC